MHDTTAPLTTFEQVCSGCIDDLYHMACIALIDANAAEKLVTKICVEGVHKYYRMDDEAEICFRLTSDLYHGMKRRLRFYKPRTDELPMQMRLLTKSERLVVAIYFFSGMSAENSGRILGLTSDELNELLSDILHRSKAVDQE